MVGVPVGGIGKLSGAAKFVESDSAVETTRKQNIRTGLVAGYQVSNPCRRDVPADVQEPATVISSDSPISESNEARRKEREVQSSVVKHQQLSTNKFQVTNTPGSRGCHYVQWILYLAGSHMITFGCKLLIG